MGDESPKALRQTMNSASLVLVGVALFVLFCAFFARLANDNYRKYGPVICEPSPCTSQQLQAAGVPPTANDDGSEYLNFGLTFGALIGIPALIVMCSASTKLRQLEVDLLDRVYAEERHRKSEQPEDDVASRNIS